MKVALILCRTLGDVILIHNLVDAIYKKYGEVEIDVYVDEAYENIVQGNPKITNIITSPSWIKNWGKIGQLLVNDVYDDVIIPQQIRGEDTIWHQLEHLRHQHLLDYYLQRSRLPKRTTEDKLQIFITKENKLAIKALLEVHSFPLKSYYVIHTTSGVPTKDWDSFNELAQKLIDEGGMVIQVGSSSDKILEGNFGERYLDARENLSFREVSELCNNSICFIGLDSGLSYISAASGANTIVLQGSTVPETSGPFGPNVKHILSPTLPQCKNIRCHTNCRHTEQAKGKCINFITVDKVYESIKEVK